MAQRIKNYEEFKKLAGNTEGGLDYFIALKGGFKSSKHVSFDGKIFYIENYIDSTEEVLNEKEFKKSNSFKALEKGSLFRE